MGRLQKKKTTVQKNKTKQKVEKAIETDKGDSEGAGSLPVSSNKVVGNAKPLVNISNESFFGKWIQFLREVKIELKKVTWPTRKQTVASTIGVIILVIIVSLFLGIVDMGLSSLVRIILG